MFGSPRHELSEPITVNADARTWLDIACYSFAVCQLLMRFHFAALPATIIASVVWLAVAFALLAGFGGAAA